MAQPKIIFLIYYYYCKNEKEGMVRLAIPKEVKKYLKLEVRSQDLLIMSTMRFIQVPFQMGFPGGSDGKESS